MEYQPSYHIDSDLFLQHGTSLLEFLADQLRSLEGVGIKPKLKPGELAAGFAREAPEQPKEFAKLVKDLETKIIPGVTHWQHPRFFSYYPAASSMPAILSELVIAALGSVGLQWSANPIGTELECVVMDWIAKMIQLPEDSPFLHSSALGGGIIQNTAGDALVAVMTAARIRKHMQSAGLESLNELSTEDRESFFYRDSSTLVLYMSDQTHFSGPKAARVAGIRIRILKAEILVDGNYGITADQVRKAMAEDRRLGLVPCAVQLNFGSTNTCGYDDITSFAGFAEQERVWIHIDAAYAGASLILPQFKERSLAIQKVATSFNFNGSKWFLCGFDSAFLYIRDRRLLNEVFAASAVYLDRTQTEEVYSPEFKDWSVPLGRRFRSLRIWMVIEYFGVRGIQEFLQAAIDQADWLRQQIRASKDFELATHTDLGLVCFRLKTDPEKHTEPFVKSLQAGSVDGGAFLVYPSQLNGSAMIRVALGGANTRLEDVKSFWHCCQEWVRFSQG